MPNEIETHQEDTELVDVSEVSEAFQEPVTTQEKSVEEESYDHLEARSTIATIRERFAAFFIDSLLLFYIYVLVGILCRRAFYSSWDGPIPCYGWQGLATHGIFLFVAFMYYFILEGIFLATPGKFLCWMYVRRKDGAFPSMSSIFLRNLFRLLDYVIPVLPFFLMELTRRNQRFGDLIARTTVIKKHSPREVHYPVSMANVASASGRLLSAVIDIAIAGGLTFGYLLLLTPTSPGLSKWMLLFSPVVPFLYFVLSESLTHTSPGKWAFGYVVCQEDGSPVSFPSSVVRTFARLFDLNPIGLISIWLSPKRQRPGDIMADTLITAQNRRWQGAVALVLWFFISSGVLWFGSNNKTNLLSQDFKFNFYPTMEIMGKVAEESAYKELTLMHLRFAAGDISTIRTPPIFKPGETVLIISEAYGYERSGRMVWLQEDIDVRYPDTSIGLHQENIVDFHQVTQTKGPIELSNSIKLPADAKDGVYTVTITVRDLFSHESKQIRDTFEVKSPAPPEQPTPPQPTTPQPSLNAPPPGTQLPPSGNQPLPQTGQNGPNI